MNVHSLEEAKSTRDRPGDTPGSVPGPSPGLTPVCPRVWPVSRGAEMEPCDGRQAPDHERERSTVVPAQREQLRQRAIRTEALREEGDLLLEGGGPLVIAEVAAVQRMFEGAHRVLGPVREH